MPMKGTSKRGIIRITTHKLSEDWVRIDIADSGTGIPETVQDRIFEPFYTTKEGLAKAPAKDLPLPTQLSWISIRVS